MAASFAEKFRLTLAAAGLLAVLGCTAPRHADLATQLQHSPAIEAAYTADKNWWTVYDDEQLNRLVETALASNVDLAKSAVSINRALYRAKLLGADLLPAFSADAQGSARRNIKVGDHSVRTISGEFAVNYEVDLWRKIADAASAGEWEYLATVEDLESARLALINNVVDAYFHLAYVDDSILVTRGSIANYARIKDVAQTKFDYGKVDAIEPALALQSLLGAEGSLISLESERKQTEQTLRDLLNLRPEAPLEFVAPDILKMPVSGVELDVPMAVLVNRPDLRASQNRLQSAFKDLRSAEKDWFPTVSLGTSLSSSSDKVKSMIDVPFLYGAISVNLPFLQWNTVKWNIKISEADYEEALLDFEQSLTTALNEVNAYFYQYQKALEALSNAKLKHGQDVKVSGYYKERYESGADELSDWLGALNTEMSSRINLINSRYSLIRYENMLFKAMAGRYVKVGPAAAEGAGMGSESGQAGPAAKQVNHE